MKKKWVFCCPCTYSFTIGLDYHPLINIYLISDRESSLQFNKDDNLNSVRLYVIGVKFLLRLFPVQLESQDKILPKFHVHLGRLLD